MISTNIIANCNMHLTIFIGTYKKNKHDFDDEQN